MSDFKNIHEQLDEILQQLNSLKEKNSELTEQNEYLKSMVIKRYDMERMKLWVDVCTATASASNSNHHECIVTWADYALKAFDERFKKNYPYEY